MSCKELDDKLRKHAKRKVSIRKQLSGTNERPRMSVFKSNTHMYVQVIDDSVGHTLAAASSVEKVLKDLSRNVEGAGKLGEEIGKRLLEKGIKTVVFDRNGFKYHGIVKAIADGARKAGITF
ncbi:MAG: large subunit ribosomal protein L18 [Spirochaetes bacterium]|nr:MAG: large subunit ribosomal protein L18 [Spirochaetota bacterium]